MQKWVSHPPQACANKMRSTSISLSTKWPMFQYFTTWKDKKILKKNLTHKVYLKGMHVILLERDVNMKYQGYRTSTILSKGCTLSRCYEKCFLFHLKSSFRSRDIEIFVCSSSPLFFPVSHCFRGWFKKHFKVYDVINCLNKNLITHYAWYLEKKIWCDIETLSIDRVLTPDYFNGKIMQKICTKS